MRMIHSGQKQTVYRSLIEMSTQTKSRKRPAPNWYPDEYDTLINEATQHESLLSSKLNTTVSKEDKSRVWAEISATVSGPLAHARRSTYSQ